jgi:Flp pilus assembly protein CpaB
LAVAPAPARPRPGGGRLFIIVGLILALAAGAGVYFLGGALGGGGGIGGGGTTKVVVAKQAIPSRHALTADDVDVQSVSGAFSTVNTYANKTDPVGLIAEIQISRGSVITSDMLAKDIGLVPAGAAPAYLPLATGYVAYTIPTGEQQGVAGNITLGDYITVISSASISVFAVGATQPTGPAKIVSKTVFTNVRVIGLGPRTVNVQPAGGATTAGTSGPVGGVVSSLTIELTQCDAEFFTWFLNNTTVKYTLESFHDYLTQLPSASEVGCPAVQSAQGVSQKEVEARYHFTNL